MANGNPCEHVFTVGSAQALACWLLREIQIESPMLEAQLLLGHVLKMDRIGVSLARKVPLSGEQARHFWSLIKRRLACEPMAYILGYKEFFGLTLLVNQDCLIPRPDTEVVVEKCLSLLPDQEGVVVFDICTGSGAIAHALLTSLKNVRVVGSDICPKALAIAQKNAENLGVDARFTALEGDLFTCFFGHEKASLIVANPPYISTGAMQDLARDILDYEPQKALHAGDEHGISFYARILNQAGAHLEPGGYLVFEIGFDQKEKIKSLVGSDWYVVEFFEDLAGNTRGVVLQKT